MSLFVETAGFGIGIVHDRDLGAERRHGHVPPAERDRRHVPVDGCQVDDPAVRNGVAEEVGPRPGTPFVPVPVHERRPDPCVRRVFPVPTVHLLHGRPLDVAHQKEIAPVGGPGEIIHAPGERGDSLGIPAGHGHAPDLGAAAPCGDERHRPAVRRPARASVISRPLGELPGRPAGRRHDPDT